MRYNYRAARHNRLLGPPLALRRRGYPSRSPGWRRIYRPGLPNVIRELRRLLEINRELSPTEIDALCELRLVVRREFLSQPLEKR